MKKLLLPAVLLSFVFALFSAGFASASASDAVLSPGHWIDEGLTNFAPFWEKTIDNENGGFFTNINEDGTQGEPANKYTRMNSRVVFGFCVAYLISGDDKYLVFAKHGMDFLSQYCYDKDNGGWATTVDEGGDPDGGNKNLFDETYGNVGPILYYFTTGDKNALSLVSKTHALMQSNAWDKQNGGYYAYVGYNWSTATGTKSFNSMLDTCTAYLIYYYMSTRDPSVLKDLTATGGTILAHMIDKNGFVGESFDGEWNSLETNLWVGHNLKTAWVLTRLYYITGDKKYLDAAEKIASGQIKYTWDKKFGGWFFHFDAKSPLITDDDKDWWTQEEGDNLMLSLYHITGNKKFLDKFIAGAKFWDKYFVDNKYGEVYERLDRGGKPSIRAKADYYKSSYHSMETVLTNYLYLSLYKNHADTPLYFSLSADAAGEKHYVNILEDPAVVIKAVAIDGKPWTDFNAVEGYINLPAGKDMKVKVTLGMAGQS